MNEQPPDRVALSPSVEPRNPGRILWPGDGLTQGDLIAYYRAMAPAFLPHAHNRPVTMRVYPDGIDGRSYFRRKISPRAPIEFGHFRYEATIDRHAIDVPIINDLNAALWYVNAGAIEFHLWTSRAPRLDEPDHVILDLDADRDVDFGTILNAGALVHDALVELNLRGFPKTSGAGGLHVYLPLSAEYAFADVRGWVDAFSRRLARRFPETFAIAKRGSHASDRVTIDSAQNSIGRNTAAPYTVRARPGAPVSAPLTWVEVHDGHVKPADFNLLNAATVCAARRPIRASASPRSAADFARRLTVQPPACCSRSASSAVMRYPRCASFHSVP